MNNLIILIIILLVIIVIVLFIVNYTKSNQINALRLENFCQSSHQQNNQQNNQNKQNNKNNKEMTKNKLVLYYSQQCGHCKNFKPIWDQFCKENNINIETVAIDCEKEQCPDDVKGYPTVMLHKQNGQKITFDGQRTVPALNRFLEGA